MTVEKVEQLDDKTIFHIYEPTKRRKPDKRRTVEVPHDKDFKLQTITKEKVEEPKRTREYQESFQKFEVPEVGTVIFHNIFDTDFYAENHQKGSHSTYGPLLLID